MPAAKKKAKEASVTEFLDKISDARLRSDARALLALMQEVTKEEPKLWGGNIVGFGTYHYVNKGRQGDWCLAGFSPRGGTLALFVLGGWDSYADLLAKLGPHSLRAEILTLKRLADANGPTLKRLIATAYKGAQARAKVEAKQRA